MFTKLKRLISHLSLCAIIGNGVVHLWRVVDCVWIEFLNKYSARKDVQVLLRLHYDEWEKQMKKNVVPLDGFFFFFSFSFWANNTLHFSLHQRVMTTTKTTRTESNNADSFKRKILKCYEKCVEFHYLFFYSNTHARRTGERNWNEISGIWMETGDAAVVACGMKNDDIVIYSLSVRRVDKSR